MNVLKLGLVVLGMVSLVASAFAAQGFSVSSARDFITVQAGSSAEFFANVKNVTTTPLNYGTYISYIEMFNDGAIPFDVTPKNGSIASGREALLKLSIPVPRNAFNGVYVVD
ncbi:MAG TPA: hypothetical protein VJA40_05700, partial [archaeon]|nr:hypothetical protein [archaeon]